MSGPQNQLDGEIPPPPVGPPPGPSSGPGATRYALIAALSTVVVFALLAYVVVNAPGWERVKASFFDWDQFVESAPGIVAA